MSKAGLKKRNWLKPIWKQVRRFYRKVKDPVLHWGGSLIVGTMIVALYSVKWAGFGERTIPPNTIPAKTLWDWMELILVPLALGLTVIYFNILNSKTEREIANKRIQEEREAAIEQRREDTLQQYLDQVTSLLLSEDLRNSEQVSEVRDIARVRTLTTLRMLDVSRKEILIEFLIEAGLVQGEPDDMRPPIIDLAKADLAGIKLLRSNLSGAILEEANLQRANLAGTDLSSVILVRADLTESILAEAELTNADLTTACLKKANLKVALLEGANLTAATMTAANLTEAYLENANLSNANLIGANLSNADLKGAYLGGARLIGANLDGADLSNARLPNAVLPDGSKWTDDTNMSHFTDANHPEFWQSSDTK